MPGTLLYDHRQVLNSMADAWLSAGAASFQIWAGRRCLASWPASESAPAHTLVAPLVGCDGRQAGELRTVGPTTPADHARLMADAHALSALLCLGNEIDSLAGALSETEDQLLALYALNRNSLGHLDLDQLLISLTRQMARLTKARAAFTMLWPDTVVQHPETVAPEEVLFQLFARVRVQEDELLLSGPAASLSTTSADDSLFLIRLPIYEGEASIAAIGLLLKRPATALSPDLKLARSIAQYAASQIEIALQHRDLLAKGQLQAELDLARQVQLGLLPVAPPQMPGLALFAESQPALEVGGDFYDFYPRASASGRAGKSADRRTGQLAFAVGDISGKGMPAALLMAMTRTSLRDIFDAAVRVQTRTTNGGLRLPLPRAVVESANRNLYDDFTDVGMMATLFVGHFDPETRTLTYANAGHSPVIHCPYGQGARLLEADGTALGVLPITLSEDHTLRLEPDDVLIVGTDGFSEARNPAGEMFGYDRMLQVVDSIADRDAAQIGAALYGAVSDFSRGRPQDDDQTLVVVKGG